MKSQLPSCLLTPERAQAVWLQSAAQHAERPLLALTQTRTFRGAIESFYAQFAPLRATTCLAVSHTATLFAAHEALDCLGSTHEHARETMGSAEYGRAIVTQSGTSHDIEHHRVLLADPAGRRRARRLPHGNAHAHRCAPPGRNAGGGPQRKPH